MTMISREDSLMYRIHEARDLQRDLERLQTKIDAIKLEAMERLYKEAQITKE
jgi:hypothetical protein